MRLKRYWVFNRSVGGTKRKYRSAINQGKNGKGIFQRLCGLFDAETDINGEQPTENWACWAMLKNILKCVSNGFQKII